MAQSVVESGTTTPPALRRDGRSTGPGQPRSAGDQVTPGGSQMIHVKWTVAAAIAALVLVASACGGTEDEGRAGIGDYSQAGARISRPCCHADSQSDQCGGAADNPGRPRGAKDRGVRRTDDHSRRGQRDGRPAGQGVRQGRRDRRSPDPDAHLGLQLRDGKRRPDVLAPDRQGPATTARDLAAKSRDLLRRQDPCAPSPAWSFRTATPT